MGHVWPTWQCTHMYVALSILHHRIDRVKRVLVAVLVGKNEHIGDSGRPINAKKQLELYISNLARQYGPMKHSNK